MKFYLTTILLFISQIYSQIVGCTDVQAINYNSLATTNDGSCIYPPTMLNITSNTISSSLSETSGLIYWNQHFYTHNDDTDTNMYEIDSVGTIIQSIPLSISNIDWEEISQDDTYIYIGDFGNNTSGNRTNLRVFKILKSSLFSVPIIDTIRFFYSNQTDFSSQPSNATNFDCEAMIVQNDTIHLFTKNWLNLKTNWYRFPAVSGLHSAEFVDSLNVGGLITGATFNSDSNFICLIGYTGLLQPFLYLLYDYNTHFFQGNKRKVILNSSFRQAESISFWKNDTLVFTNENLTIPVATSQAINYVSIHSLFTNTSSIDELENNPYHLHQDSEFLMIENLHLNSEISISNLLGQELVHFNSLESEMSIEKSNLKNQFVVIQINHWRKLVFIY